MGKLMQKLLGKNKRQKLTIAAVAFILYVLALSGIFSYFHGSDAVTNRLTAKQGSIALIEEKWDSTGKAMAAKSEPGMQIPKDPVAVNDSATTEFCRIQMTVTVGNDSNPLLDGSAYNRNSKQEIKGIIDAICLDKNGTQLIKVDDDLKPTGDCNNPSFHVVSEADYVADSRSMTYYFYYIGNDKNMKVMNPDDRTVALFEYVLIPKYKADYLGIFDLNYNIVLEAQAIPAVSGEILSPVDAKAKFTS